MTPIDRFERHLTDRLTELADPHVPDYFDDLLTRTGRSRQRPAWTFIERWLPMALLTQSGARVRPMRQTWQLLVVLAITLALVAGLAIGGARLLGLVPPVDRLNGTSVVTSAEAAVLAYSVFERNDYDGDVYTIRADGTGKRHVGRGFDPIWSPDGSMIAFYSNPGGLADCCDGWDLMVADPSGVRLLANRIGCHGLGDGAGAPVWSPDSRFILYVAFRGNPSDCYNTENWALQDLYVIPADGSSEGHRLLKSSASGMSSTWSRDGTKIAFQAQDGIESSLWVADVINQAAPWGLDSHQISKPGATSLYDWALPRWSPDGTTIATTRIPPGDDPVKADSVVIAADGSSETMLWPSTTVDNGLPDWSPDGAHLSVTAREGIGSEFDEYALYLVDPDGSDRVQVDSPPLSGYSGVMPFSSDGSRVIARSPTRSFLYIITLDGSAEVVAIPTVGQQSASSWQPVPNADSPLSWPDASPAP
jgi:Tol biopolymer transport system component